MKKTVASLIGLMLICLTVEIKSAMATTNENELDLENRLMGLLERSVAPSVIYVSPRISKVRDGLNVKMYVAGCFTGITIQDIFNSVVERRESNKFVILKVIMRDEGKLLFIYTDKTNFRE